jgi:carboxyl-terminal processing protease
VDEAEGVADELLSSGVIYTTRHRGKVIDEVVAHDGGAFAGIPIVALVNEFTASSAELVAGAIQDNGRASIVGAPTFGKGSVQTIFELPGGAGMRLTTMRYYTPSGRSIQAQGIKPDVLIEPGKPPLPGQVVRESDLDGHLAPEGAARPAPAPAAPVLIDKEGKGPATTADEIPTDPAKGDDFSLSVGYGILMKAIADKRAAR